ncbi:MAG: transporter substrate-binding domain-containing protein [Pseudomonas marincola]
MSFFIKTKIACTILVVLISLITSSILTSASAIADAPFKIVYASAWPPYSEGEGPRVVGILPSLMEELISGKLDIQVEHFGVPWARAQQMVKKGTADAFITAPTAERLTYAYSSAEYVYSVEFNPAVIKGTIIHKRISKGAKIPDDLTKFRFCDVLGNNWAKHYYGKRNITYTIARNAEECVKMIHAGRLDIFIHPSDVTRQAIENCGLGDAFEIFDAVPESPMFTLLLSKKSKFDVSLIKRFDEVLSNAKSDGTYAQMLLKYRKTHQDDKQ